MEKPPRKWPTLDTNKCKLFYPSQIILYLADFAVIWVKRRQKAGFLSPRISKITVTRKKERRKRKSEEKKKTMVALLVFITATLEMPVFGRKKLLDDNVIKNPARYIIIQEIPVFFLIFPCRTNIRISKQWVKLSVCLAKYFNNSFFLSHIYSLLSYILFHFLSLILCGIHSSVPLIIHMVYPTS